MHYRLRTLLILLACALGYRHRTLESKPAFTFSLRKLVLYLVFAPPVLAWGATVLWRHHVLINTPTHELIQERSPDRIQPIRRPAVVLRNQDAKS